jgi:hypothetical protein
MPDITPPTNDERGEYALRLIAARCPELSEAEIALLRDSQLDPDAIPTNIADQILSVVERMADRMDAFERRFA